MVVERALVTPRKARFSRDHLEHHNPVLENERSLLEKSMGIDLTSIILSHLTTGSLTTLLRNPSELLSYLPSYPKLQALNKFKGPEDEVKIFTELFASALTKSWNAENTKNVSEKESRLALYCTELRNKGYSLKRVMQEVCKHFNLSLTEALAIAKKEYFTIDDLAQELEMDKRNARNRVSAVLKKDRTINAERFGGKERRRVFIPQSQRNDLKSTLNSSIHKTTVTLPDNSVATIKGRLRKKILDMLLQTFNQPHGLALDKVIDLYPKGDRDARVKAHHVIQDFRKKLQAFGWIIENRYISKGKGHKPISEYFLKKIEVPIAEAPVITPLGIKDETETTIFDAGNTRPGKKTRLYSTPIGEKPFYSLADIARDLAAKESDVKKALQSIGIKGPKNSSSHGGKKREMKLSYSEYQIIRSSLQQEVKRRNKKPKREPTSSPALKFPKGTIHS